MMRSRSVLFALGLSAVLGMAIRAGDSAAAWLSESNGKVAVGGGAADRPGDEAARRAFQREVFIPLGGRNNTSSFTVPGGKRLVIEYVSASGNVPFGQNLLFALKTCVNDSCAVHFLVPSRFTFARVTTPDGELIRTRQWMRVYADGGTEVMVSARRSGNWGGGSATLSISGYLVELPQHPRAAAGRAAR
jgi:hypothetical protein